MGVKLLGKIKIHEIAKEIGLTSKEVIERAKELGIEVKSHLSAIEEKEAEKIEKSFEKVNTKKTEKKQTENKGAKQQEKKMKNDGPVIIRREVIISEEEMMKKEEEEKRRKQQERKANVGFVERDKNKDFNIVYRNKPTKPLTVEELFGLNKKKKD